MVIRRLERGRVVKFEQPKKRLFDLGRIFVQLLSPQFKCVSDHRIGRPVFGHGIQRAFVVKGFDRGIGLCDQRIGFALDRVGALEALACKPIGMTRRAHLEHRVAIRFKLAFRQPLHRQVRQKILLENRACEHRAQPDIRHVPVLPIGHVTRRATRRLLGVPVHIVQNPVNAGLIRFHHRMIRPAVTHFARLGFPCKSRAELVARMTRIAPPHAAIGKARANAVTPHAPLFLHGPRLRQKTRIRQRGQFCIGMPAFGKRLDLFRVAFPTRACGHLPARGKNRLVVLAVAICTSHMRPKMGTFAPLLIHARIDGSVASLAGLIILNPPQKPRMRGEPSRGFGSQQIERPTRAAYRQRNEADPLHPLLHDIHLFI